VFDGNSGAPYRESDATGPVNEYGRAKLSGERAVLEAYPDALVVRTTIYGWNAQPKQSLGEFFVTRLAKGQRTPGFSDVWMTPILASDLAALLLRLQVLDTRGILHVSGRDCISKGDFGRRVAAEFGYDPKLVDSVSIRDNPLAVVRPMRPCLNVEKAETLLGDMPSVREGISRFRSTRDEGLSRRLQSLLEGAQ
jgi:dTDP-4-dehydrorhamnose reductase